MPEWLVTCSCGWTRECSSRWAAESVAKLHPKLGASTAATPSAWTRLRIRSSDSRICRSRKPFGLGPATEAISVQPPLSGSQRGVPHIAATMPTAKTNRTARTTKY